MEHHLVLRVVAKVLIPPIILYGLYVQFHGEYGPGGGFQAGVIIAAAFILYGLIFGLNDLCRAIPLSALRASLAIGALIFIGTGFVTLALGGRFLDYAVLYEHDFKEAQVIGIIVVELGVGIAVAAAISSIYIAFAGRTPAIRDEDW